MASSISSQGLRLPQTLLPSPPKPGSRLPSTRAAPLVSSPSAVASVRSRGLASRSDVVRSRVVARASASGIGPDISDVLGDVRIFTAAGEPVLFKDLWDQNEGVAVVAMLRHFGCICCWELASVLKESKAKFDSAGVKLIAVGVGTPDKARILAERVLVSCGLAIFRPVKSSRNLDMPEENATVLDQQENIDSLPFPMDCLYADPDRKSYDVLGLYYGLGRTFFNPASAKVFSRFDSFQKAANNYTIGATPDDRSSILQQGGMLVFKGKQLLYARKDEGTGDHAPLDDIFDICCKVPVS